MISKPNNKQQESLTRLLRFATLVVLAAGIYRGNTGIIVNAAVALGISLLPAYLERDAGVELDPFLALWLTAAVFLHAFGTLGPYKSLWWWDHLTHTLSSSVVAAAGYTVFRSVDEHYDGVHFPPKLFFVFILLFVVAFGVIWELLEFGISGLADILGSKTVLTQYGLEDTMKDLVFDTLGGIVVALFGEVYLLGVVDQIIDKLESRAFN